MPRRAKTRPDEPGAAKILAAGRDVFAERGYHAASIAAIGERAEITKSALYHHYGSKAGLYEAVLAAETRDALANVTAAVDGVDSLDRLRAGLDAYLQHLAERRAAWRLLLRDRPADPEAAAIYDRFQAERATALAELLRSDDPVLDDAQHQLVIAAIRAFCTWWYDHPDVERERILDSILSFKAVLAEDALAD